MRKLALLAISFSLALIGSARAQSARPSSGGIDVLLPKILGDNIAFTADALLTETARGESTEIPGKIAYNAGQLRIELHLADAKAPRMNPQNLAHLRTMGLDKTVNIYGPDKKVVYFLYPNLSEYYETPRPSADKGSPALKTKTTELGKETVDGHPCTKNKVTITDDQGAIYDNTVWNATDLKQFPVKIEMTGKR